MPVPGVILSKRELTKINFSLQEKLEDVLNQLSTRYLEAEANGLPEGPLRQCTFALSKFIAAS
jgi:hypothetical protein